MFAEEEALEEQETSPIYYVFSSTESYLGCIDKPSVDSLTNGGARRRGHVLVLEDEQGFAPEASFGNKVEDNIKLLALNGSIVTMEPSRFIETFGIDWDPSIDTYGKALRRSAEVEQALEALRPDFGPSHHEDADSALDAEAERLGGQYIGYLMVAKSYTAHPTVTAIDMVEKFLSGEPSRWQGESEGEKKTREAVLQGSLSAREALENAETDAMCARLVLLAMDYQWRVVSTSKWIDAEARKKIAGSRRSKDVKRTFQTYVNALMKQQRGETGEVNALSIALRELRNRPLVYGGRELEVAIQRQPHIVDRMLKGWETDTRKAGVILDCLLGSVIEEQRHRLAKEAEAKKKREAQLEKERIERERQREEEKRAARAEREKNRAIPLREGELIALAEKSLTEVGASESVWDKMIGLVALIDPSNKQVSERKRRRELTELGARAVRYIKENPKKCPQDKYVKRILQGKTDNPFTSVLSNNRLAESFCGVLARELADDGSQNPIADSSWQQQSAEKPTLTDSRHAAQVDFDSPGYTLLICKGIYSCEKKHHTIVSATGYITSLKGRPISINVNHCLDCNTFFISQNEYEHYRDVYGPVLGNFEFSSFRSGSGHSFDDFADRSILNLCGYSVSQADGYTADERQLILANILDRGIVSKPRLINYLEFFIRVNRNAANKRTAVKKWSDDLNWVRNYRINAQRKFRVSSIKRAR